MLPSPSVLLSDLYGSRFSCVVDPEEARPVSVFDGDRAWLAGRYVVADVYCRARGALGRECCRAAPWPDSAEVQVSFLPYPRSYIEHMAHELAVLDSLTDFYLARITRLRTLPMHPAGLSESWLAQATRDPANGTDVQ